MVGIVIVSHSSDIAKGVVELSKQMAQEEVKIIAVGGTRDGRIGTDATMIMEAITEADTGDGVIILADLGSAIMSAQTAIELLEEEQRARVLIADAPLVEGSVAASIQASFNSSLSETKTIAEEAKYLQKL